MSSYFFGGFSANLIEPSGRQSNHSGCCLIQGWSGEHWMAKSSAISSPCAWAASTRRRKSLKRAELGMDGVVPALFRTDRVDAADIAGQRLQRVVLALAVGAPDWVDRREVEHVEAEVLHVRELRDHVVEGAVPLRIARLRAREHLVPGREPRREAVGDRPPGRGRSGKGCAARRCGRRARHWRASSSSASCAAEPSSACLRRAINASSAWASSLSACAPARSAMRTPSIVSRRTFEPGSALLLELARARSPNRRASPRW